jgi:hypothetical protein
VRGHKRDKVRQAFQPAGGVDFPVATAFDPADWKSASPADKKVRVVFQGIGCFAQRVRNAGQQPCIQVREAGPGQGARRMMLVHHDDAAREFAYGADSKIGTFSDALTAEANKTGWAGISMKNDWQCNLRVEP